VANPASDEIVGTDVQASTVSGSRGLSAFFVP
jgi:hypothetical protein